VVYSHFKNDDGIVNHKLNINGSKKEKLKLKMPKRCSTENYKPTKRRACIDKTQLEKCDHRTCDTIVFLSRIFYAYVSVFFCISTYNPIL